MLHAQSLASMIIVLIPVKGHSNRLPNKNMIDLNGRPMIDYAIDQSLASKRAGAVYVTTDSDAIAAHAKARGVGVIRRPETLGGETPLVAVFRHALEVIGDPAITVVVGVQADHPDRTIAVDDAIAAFEAGGSECDLLASEEPSGKHSGAHYILSRRYVETGECRKKVVIVDDCTNVHTVEDLACAAARLRARAGIAA